MAPSEIRVHATGCWVGDYVLGRFRRCVSGYASEVLIVTLGVGACFGYVLEGMCWGMFRPIELSAFLTHTYVQGHSSTASN